MLEYHPKVVVEGDGVRDEGHKDLEVDEGGSQRSALWAVGVVANIRVAPRLGVLLERLTEQLRSVGTDDPEQYQEDDRGPTPVLECVWSRELP